MKFIARQFRQPTGHFGRLWGRLMDSGNARIIAGSINALGVQPQHHILEIGFGGGFGLELLLDNVQRGSVTGVEISDVMMSRAEKRFARAINQKRLSLFSASVEQLPLGTSIFDGVLTVNTVYFWSDLKRGMSEIFRVLKPGGQLVLGIRPAEAMRRLPFTRHGFSIFVSPQLEEMLHQTGFQEIVSERYKVDRLGYI
ncbi:MAG: methyltransferase domain-containing protein [Actinomycetota bacterium]